MYRFEATSVEGFVQQLAANYVANGYWSYVCGKIPESKDPRVVDRKLLGLYGIEISKTRLSRVERAEAALREALLTAGIEVRDLRVRDLGPAGASVEVDALVVPELAARPELLAVVQGFPAVSLDPRGFRSGALNERL